MTEPPTDPRAGVAPPRDDDDALDRALLAAHAGGDRDAFATLVRRHTPRLWAVALRTLHDREEAADALQDALLSAHRAAAGFRGDARVTTWLHRVVVNACLDRARRRQVRPTVALPDHAETTIADPRDAVDEAELSLDLTAALATLPEEQRLAIVLVDLQGLSVAEAAEVLGVAEGTVKSRCSRGRARLAVLLGHLRNRPGPAAVPPAGPTTDHPRGTTEGGADR